MVGTDDGRVAPRPAVWTMTSDGPRHARVRWWRQPRPPVNWLGEWRSVLFVVFFDIAGVVGGLEGLLGHGDLRGWPALVAFVLGVLFLAGQVAYLARPVPVDPPGARPRHAREGDEVSG